MLLQTLIQLKQATNQKGPAAPKRAQTRLILGPAMGIDAKAGTKRETDAAHQIPKADVPTQCAKRRLPPPTLCLKHEQGTGDDEAGATDDLGSPVGSVERRSGREVLEDGRKGGDAGNPEDGRTEELGRAGDEAELVKVMVAQVAPGRKPRPTVVLGPVVRAVLVLLLRKLLRRSLAALLALPHQVQPVLVVVFATSWARGDPQPRTFVRAIRAQDLLDCPTEAACAVLVDGFEHE